jgi:hypothetical protein
MEAAAEARRNDTGSYTMADILSGGSTPAIGKKTSFPESKGSGHEHSKWDFLGNRDTRKECTRYHRGLCTSLHFSSLFI